MEREGKSDTWSWLDFLDADCLFDETGLLLLAAGLLLIVVVWAVNRLWRGFP